MKQSNSRLFNGILVKYLSGLLDKEFRVKDVKDVLRTSSPFLSKHCIDPKDKRKISEGNPYFVRVNVGLYKINPIYLA